MRTTLKAATLLLVQDRAKKRGSLEDLAAATEVPYFTLWRFARGDIDKIDADACQRVYEHLAGHKLDIR